MRGATVHRAVLWAEFTRYPSIVRTVRESNPRLIADLFNPLFEQLSRTFGADFERGHSPIRIDFAVEGTVCENG
jgi:hypothetical protein